MGIDLQWIDERGEILERVLDERNLISEIIEAARKGSVCLRFIDPYGDAVFNQLQIPVLIEELQAITPSALGYEATRHYEEVIELATKANGRIHTYLKFYGD